MTGPRHDDNIVLGCLTIRDYFAAVSLQGILATPMDGLKTRGDRVKTAYQYADLMLAERGK